MNSNIFIINHQKIYEMELRLIEYLKEEWEINYYPIIHNIMECLKIDDILTRSWFRSALIHLENRNFISIRNDLNGIYRIYEGLERMPNKYEFSDYWGGI